MIKNRQHAIEVENLSKAFGVYEKASDLALEILLGKSRHEEFWALRDISFSVKRGSVLGIIGQNGAGKSTLLRILAGTLDKTSGEISTAGSISAILELGAAFKNDISGRDNAYLNALMLGISKEEIQEKLDWIIWFSELEDFIDQPFRTFSTGMRARLAFSTAISVKPDILIVDEALSVGDAKFQRKSFGEFEKFRSAGGTILLVSHDINTINSICDDAILLNKGRIIERGQPNRVSQHYYRLLFASTKRDVAPNSNGKKKKSLGAQAIDKRSTSNGWGSSPYTLDQESNKIRRWALAELGMDGAYFQENDNVMRLGNGKAEILDYGILDNNGQKTRLLKTGQSYEFYFKAVYYEDVEMASAGFLVRDIRGIEMFGATLHSLGGEPVPRKTGDIVEVSLSVTMWLTNGIYFLTINTAHPYKSDDFQYDSLFDGYEFEVGRLVTLMHSSKVNLQPVIRVTDISRNESNENGDQ